MHVFVEAVFAFNIFNRIDVDVLLKVNKVYNVERGIAKKSYTINKLVNAVVKQATKNIEIRGASAKAL